jgi:hypothetical protein
MTYITASCGEVNDRIRRLLGEASPTVHLAHRDLARSQHRSAINNLKHERSLRSGTRLAMVRDLNKEKFPIAGCGIETLLASVRL